MAIYAALGSIKGPLDHVVNSYINSLYLAEGMNGLLLMAWIDDAIEGVIQKV